MKIKQLLDLCECEEHLAAVNHAAENLGWDGLLEDRYAGKTACHRAMTLWSGAAQAMGEDKSRDILIDEINYWLEAEKKEVELNCELCGYVIKDGVFGDAEGSIACPSCMGWDGSDPSLLLDQSQAEEQMLENERELE